MRSAVFLTLVTLLAATGPISADWLVYRDGTRLETAGEWKTKGKLVVFSLPNGTLSAVKTDELDLDASRELTRAFARARDERNSRVASRDPATETATPRRKATIVITDADVGHVDSAQLDSSTDAEPEPVVRERGLEVTKWGSGESDADGIVVVGHLRNSSDHASTAVTVTVRALGQDDAVLIEQPATLDVTTLMPGQSTRFEARLNRVFSFNELTFETSSLDLEVASPESPPPS